MSDPFTTAIEQLNAINAINAEDPNQLEVDGERRPRDLVAASRRHGAK